MTKKYIEVQLRVAQLGEDIIATSPNDEQGNQQILGPERRGRNIWE